MSFLNHFALLIFIVLYVLTIGILPVGRWLLEGSFYNIAWSSRLRDVALIAIVLIASNILKRSPVGPESWLASSGYHAITIALSFAAGAMVEVKVRSDHALRLGNQFMDMYHNFVVVPIFLYLLLAIALPVELQYGVGWEILVSFSLAGVWGILLVYDITTGRIDQERWRKQQSLA